MDNKFFNSWDMTLSNYTFDKNMSQSLIDVYFNSVEYVFKYSTKSFIYNFELTYFDFVDTLNVVSSNLFTNIFIELC